MVAPTNSISKRAKKYQSNRNIKSLSQLAQGNVKTSISGGIYAFSPLTTDGESQQGPDSAAVDDDDSPQQQDVTNANATIYSKPSFHNYQFPALGNPIEKPKVSHNGIFLDDSGIEEHSAHSSKSQKQRKTAPKRTEKRKKFNATEHLSPIDTSPKQNQENAGPRQVKSTITTTTTEESSNLHTISRSSPSQSPSSSPSTPLTVNLSSPSHSPIPSDLDQVPFTGRRRKRKSPFSSSPPTPGVTAPEPTELEQSRYYVSTLISDTYRNKKTREKMFEKEIARKGSFPRSPLSDLNLAQTKIPEKDTVTRAVENILDNIGSLMGMSSYLKDKRGNLTEKFKRTVLHLEKKVTELQAIVNEKDASLQRALRREENSVKALETSLEEALIREKEMMEKYNIPLTEHRLLSLFDRNDTKSPTSLNAIVKDRFRHHHDLDELHRKLNNQPSPTVTEIQQQLQQKLEKEHRKNTLQLRRSLDAFQREYMTLHDKYKSMENRLKFYQKDKTYMKSLRGPTGKVAIVFTDIEQSSRLWERHEQQMAQSIEMHNRIARKLLTEFSGFEVKTEGDSFMIAFGNCVEAVDFCLQLQLELLKVNWPEELLKEERCKEVRSHNGTDDSTQQDSSQSATIIWRGLRVRAGVHVGYPQVVEDLTTQRSDYMGPMVNKSARVSSEAEAGAVCVSGAVWKEIEPYIPNMRTKLWSIYLGKRSLKGIKEPEELRLVVPASLRDRKFDTTKKDSAERWPHRFSPESIEARQKYLKNQMNHMKEEIHHTMHVNALESIIKEQSTVIAFLSQQLNEKNLKPDQLTSIMGQFTKKIRQRFTDLENEVKDKVDRMATVGDKDQASETNRITPSTPVPDEKSQHLTPHVPRSPQSSKGTTSPSHSRPTSSKSNNGEDKRRKKRARRGSFIKPVEVKPVTMEISKESYNTMQHNLKYLKNQRDQAVKKQRNLAMDLLETQEKLHKLTKDVQRFKKQIKAGGNFGVASPATDYRDLEKPKLAKIDNFSDSDSPTKSKKRSKGNRSPSKKRSKKKKKQKRNLSSSMEVRMERGRSEEAHHDTSRSVDLSQLEQMTDEEFFKFGDDESMTEGTNSPQQQQSLQHLDVPSPSSNKLSGGISLPVVKSPRSPSPLTARAQHSHLYSTSPEKKRSNLLKKSLVNRLAHDAPPSSHWNGRMQDGHSAEGANIGVSNGGNMSHLGSLRNVQSRYLDGVMKSSVAKRPNPHHHPGERQSLQEAEKKAVKPQTILFSL